jgi:hypothetical protein
MARKRLLGGSIRDYVLLAQTLHEFASHALARSDDAEPET